MPNTPYRNSPGDQNRTTEGDKEIHTNTSVSATAGGVQAVPVTVRGYILVQVGGVDKKIPYFDV